LSLSENALVRGGAYPDVRSHFQADCFRIACYPDWVRWRLDELNVTP
jgi:hypothetical protein